MRGVSLLFSFCFRDCRTKRRLDRPLTSSNRGRRGERQQEDAQDHVQAATTATTKSMSLSTNINRNPIPASYLRFTCHRLWINQSINGHMNSLLDLVGKGQMYYSEAKNAPTRLKILFLWGWHGLPVRKRIFYKKFPDKIVVTAEWSLKDVKLT